MFTTYPAIDLLHGRVVRLKQGRAEDAIVYSDDPAATARHWEREGAAWLHVVNLDGAFGEAENQNASALRAILAAVKIPVQFGGGLRDLTAIQRAFEFGVARVIMGTAALEKTEIVAEALETYGAEKIAVAIDARGGSVMTRGWQQPSVVDMFEFGRQMSALGITRAIVTDIARDGMLSGLDASAMADFARAAKLRVIASGGIASLDDIRNLHRARAFGVEGAVVGQALYQGAFTLREAMQEPHAFASN
jgi:phosphoribosylformimino-5-aminoimidazole carboxamide ribotide isomerase